MKKLLFLCLLFALVACSKPNPLDPYIGVWAVQHGRPQEIEAKDFFYISITREQVESKNIQLTGNQLIIRKAELCCPFIKGPHTFYVKTWSDSELIGFVVLPMLHYDQPEKESPALELSRCQFNGTVNPDAVCVKSFSNDSLSPVNYLIEVDNQNRVYFQAFSHESHSDYSNTPLGKLKTRLLTKDEQKIYQHLLRYAKLVPEKDKWNFSGCRSGRWFVDAGYMYRGKSYEVGYWSKKYRHSNMAIQGFLYTMAKNGIWKKVDYAHHFAIEFEETPLEKSIAFLP